MLASVGFLFKNRIVGYFQSYKGIASPWEVLEDRIIADNYCYHFISPKKNIDAQKLKISAIVGKETYSSGEAFCIALMAIDCKITGERTGGFTSGNEKYILSNGSIFYHSESFFKDVHSIIYYSGILPENIKV